MAPHLFSCFGRGHDPSGDSNNNAATTDRSAEEQRKCGPVIVQLFSSQGCGTSPEAEMVATRLGRGDVELEVPMLVLAFHVEYWDYMGWKDPFGSSQWTVRQKAYVEALRLDTLYTPQVVVQGMMECMGTDEDAIVSAVRAATRFPSPAMQATFTKPSPTSLQVSFAGPLHSKVDSSGSDVMVALYESGLVTNCKAGQNKGKMLVNDYVVRRLNKMATVKNISAKKKLTGSVQFDLWEGFDAAKCGVVLFVQNSSLHIFGSQQFKIPDTV